MEEDRYAKGEKVLNQVTKSDGKSVIDSLENIAPDLGSWIIEFAYGDVISRNTINIKQRELETIAILGALGGAETQLKVHIQGCLNVGCTKEEIIESLMQLCVYAGFPRAINAVNCARDVFLNNKDQ